MCVCVCVSHVLRAIQLHVIIASFIVVFHCHEFAHRTYTHTHINICTPVCELVSYMKRREKRPTQEQMRPITEQKRPTNEQLRPINEQKRPTKELYRSFMRVCVLCARRTCKIHTRTHACTNAHTYKRTLIPIHTHEYTHTHTHEYTHTHAAKDACTTCEIHARTQT